jgi:hypothetical protein
MQTHFPLRYTLESGTQVVVNKTTDNRYDFSLTTPHGKSDNFTYVQDNRSRDEVENELDFDQLNALRAFWLKRTDIL